MKDLKIRKDGREGTLSYRECRITLVNTKHIEDGQKWEDVELGGFMIFPNLSDEINGFIYQGPCHTLTPPVIPQDWYHNMRIEMVKEAGFELA
jgi:hypothetical protein